VNNVGERVTHLFEEISSEFKTEDSKVVQIRASDLADAVNEHLDLSEDAEYRATSKSIIRKMKEHDILRRTSQKTKDSSGYTAVEIELSTFLDACDRSEITGVYHDLVSDDKPDSDESMSAHENSHGKTPQSAQSAQSAQYKCPSTSQIGRKIREWEDDEDRDTSDGVLFSDLEDYFSQSYESTEEFEEMFQEQPSRPHNEKTGVAKLLSEGDFYQPEPGRIKEL